ncbi:TadE-like protein [Actinomyces johnsonii F0542]|uniref:TadE-like protein n=1 Tax=Actinomyces johnsonii F0542 TaxID=1321818 RepID=U1QVK3_9ACTO|nr:TadE/TadG family type IV pilus assembly protein [Actinomyces johnsonii]ERH25946.1 TadE-like protein [Actinomyces johnsonii F0542]
MSRLGQEVGASSVELIIFFPLLLLVVLITVQVALTWYGNEVAIATAREVAREARANSKGGDLSAAAKANGTAYARKVGGKALTDVEIDVSTTSDQVTVRVSGKSLDVVAGLSPRVKASVTSERETFRSDR